MLILEKKNKNQKKIGKKTAEGEKEDMHYSTTSFDHEWVKWSFL